MKRKQFSLLLAGKQGCGKTTKLMQIVNAYGAKICFVYNGTGEEKIERLPTVLIENIYNTYERVFKINYDGNPKANFFSRLEKITLGKKGEVLQRVLLIFDDGMYFLTRPKEYDLENILRTRRQRNLDIIFVTHSISEIPRQFWAFFNTLILYQTSDAVGSSKNKIPNFEYINSLVNVVNARAPYQPEFINLQS